MGDFLEFLYGMEEHSGRIIVFTTNHPERLDPALLRPGRIDMQLQLGKMAPQDVERMYQLWFNRALPPAVRSRLTSSFTQAEIGRLFAGGDLDRIHRALSNQ